jgi:cytochrome c-type biogenesis protein CcmH
VLLAAGAYVLVGSPGSPDQPYARRLNGWLSADPASLAPGELAARLKYVTSRKPNDAKAWFFLGFSYGLAGDPSDAALAYDKSLALDDRQAAAWSGLGESLADLNEGQVGPDARKAFERALALDPASVPARVYLGLADIQSGDKSAGLARWRATVASLPETDPRRAELERKIAEVSGARAPAEASASQAAPMVRAMVERQAQALKTNPDDVDGWVRLVRSYAVLHDAKAEADALARARVIFKDRPADLARIERAPGG